MRTAYEIVQQLMWDSNFRNLFIDDRRAALASYYPDYEDEGLFGETALVQGLEEEAYRRIASLQRTSKDVFPCSHHLLLAYLGNEFFEDLLRRFFELRDAEHYPSGALDILEPFDSYIVAPMILATAQESTPSELVWLNSLLKYEWALWQARRVASGWPPLTNHAPRPRCLTRRCELRPQKPREGGEKAGGVLRCRGTIPLANPPGGWFILRCHLPEGW